MKRLLVLIGLVPQIAAAQGLYTPPPGVEYYCTDAAGHRAEIGHVICITASCQTWMARCEMTANNNMAMWRKVQDGCPGASALGRLQRVEPAFDAGAVDAQI